MNAPTRQSHCWGATAVQGFLLGLILLVERAEANLPPIDLGETNVTVLRTGGINPLITRVWDLPLAGFSRAPWMRFSFAFGSEEIPQDAQIFDAASFFLQDLQGNNVAVLATVDSHGVVWLPAGEGILPIPPADLTHEAREFPSLQPVMAVRQSHFVTVQLPQVYHPEIVRFVFQMFDYPNGLNSVGVVTAPELYLVPEPTLLAFSLLAAGACGIRRILIKLGWRYALK